MVWFHIPCDNDWKGHVGDVTFMAEMVRSLQKRGMNVVVKAGNAAVHTFGLSFNNGMISVNAPKGEVTIDGLLVKFLMQDVGYILSILDGCKLRDDIGVPYYKIHGRFNCLCLTPSQFDQFRREMIALEAVGRAIEKAERDKLIRDFAGSKHVVVVPDREILNIVEA